MRKLFFIAWLTVVLVALIVACAPAPTPTPVPSPPTAVPKPTEAPKPTAVPPTAAPKPTEAPKPTAIPPTATPKKIGGELLLYSCTLSGDPWQQLVNMVKDKLGADLKCLDMGTGEMTSRVTAEKGNPQNDINFGSDSSAHVTMQLQGLLEPYKGPGWQSLPANLKDPDGYWFGLYMGVIGFAYHPDRLKKLGVEPPTSWQDLLNPKLKGEVVIASPSASGTAYTVLYTLISLYGEDKAFDYWKQLDKNVAYYSKSGSEPAEKVGLGEYAVGIAFTHDIQTRVDKGMPVKITHPKEGTGWEIGAMSITKGAKHMEAAKAFIDLALTPEAQALHPLTSHRLPVVAGVKVPPGNYTLDDVKIVNMDRDKMGKDKTRLTKKWDDEIGSKR